VEVQPDRFDGEDGPVPLEAAGRGAGQDPSRPGQAAGDAGAPAPEVEERAGAPSATPAGAAPGPSPEPRPGPRPEPRGGRRGGRRRSASRIVWRLGLLLVSAFVVEYFVLPQIAGARKALSLAAHVNVGLLLAGVALEALSLGCYAQLTRTCLPRGSGVSLRTALEIDLTTLALSHVVPGGSAAGLGTGFHLLSQEGVSGSDAGFALGVQGMGSTVVLNVLLWLGLVVSIPLRGYNPLYASAAVVGVLIIGLFSGGIVLLMRGEQRAAGLFRVVARKLPFLDEAAMDGLVRRLAARTRQLLTDRRLLIAATAWAAANWLLDMACLEVFLLAFGRSVSLVGLVVSYGLANVVSAIPITPGGLGVMEAVLTATLVGFGLPRGNAILGVVGWRLVQFWLPIPVGALSYASLHLHGGGERRAQQLRQLAEQVGEEQQRLTTWARQHGIRWPPRRTGAHPGE
jgi:uncharacterized protein (TIRG00374 family)